jgi:hypothetical protein
MTKGMDIYPKPIVKTSTNTKFLLVYSASHKRMEGAWILPRMEGTADLKVMEATNRAGTVGRLGIYGRSARSSNSSRLEWITSTSKIVTMHMPCSPQKQDAERKNAP